MATYFEVYAGKELVSYFPMSAVGVYSCQKPDGATAQFGLQVLLTKPDGELNLGNSERTYLFESEHELDKACEHLNEAKTNGAGFTLSIDPIVNKHLLP
ncbi:MAG: hypothetical protein EOO60_14265 [Hymenobacter sp.]|nr:MAG: hypothetical protein EOO60_14265 [Hymenobacter sp.]